MLPAVLFFRVQPIIHSTARLLIGNTYNPFSGLKLLYKQLCKTMLLNLLTRIIFFL